MYECTMNENSEESHGPPLPTSMIHQDQILMQHRVFGRKFLFTCLKP